MRTRDINNIYCIYYMNISSINNKVNLYFQTLPQVKTYRNNKTKIQD